MTDDCFEPPPEYLASSPSATCPRCGARAGRPIVWGMLPGPPEQLWGEGVDVIIGGCVVDFPSTDRGCRACGASFKLGELWYLPPPLPNNHAPVEPAHSAPINAKPRFGTRDQWPGG